MDSEKREEHDIVPLSPPADRAIDIAAIVSSAVPWLGGPVSAVLSGYSISRKLGRVQEVLVGLATDLRDLRSTASEEYVRTEEFEELLEKTLRQAAEERSEAKRELYRLFLVDAITSPGGSYDEQVRFLRTLEELQPDHLRVVKALSVPPEGGSGLSGSPSATLGKRLTGIASDRIEELVSQLNDMRVTKLSSLRTMMTYHGSQELRWAITPYGQRLLKYILSSKNVN